MKKKFENEKNQIYFFNQKLKKIYYLFNKNLSKYNHIKYNKILNRIIFSQNQRIFSSYLKFVFFVDYLWQLFHNYNL